MGAAVRRFSPTELNLYDPDARLGQRFDYWLARTNDPNAAATLVLAEVQASSLRSTPCHEQDLPVAVPIDAGYLTVKQAATKYQLGLRTVYRLVENGMPVTRVGTAIRINPVDLELWLSAE
jgi:excisionase family DNA binding protein